MSYEGEEGSLKLRILLKSKTSSSASVEVKNDENATDWKYYYRTPTGKYDKGTSKTETPLNEYTYNGLTKGTYIFKVTAKKNGKVYEAETGEIVLDDLLDAKINFAEGYPI